MKTVFKIFGVIAILISVSMCYMSIDRSQDDKVETATALTEVNAQIAKFRELVNSSTGETKTLLAQELANTEKQIHDQPSPSTYFIIQIFLSVLLLLALSFGVFLFRPNLTLSKQLVALAVVVLLVTYFMSPDIQRGEYSGANSRTLALISGIPVVIAGLFSILAARLTLKKANI
jgi:hypothetical protein